MARRNAGEPVGSAAAEERPSASEGLGGDAPIVARLFAALASITLGAVLPVLMVIANKSAPATLVVAAVLANLAVILAGRGDVLVARYRSLMATPTARLAAGLVAVFVLSFAWSIDRGATARGLVEGLPEIVSALALMAAWPMTARRTDTVWLIAGLAAAVAMIGCERFGGMALHDLLKGRPESLDLLKRSAIPPALLAWPAMADLAARRRPWAAAGVFCLALLGAILGHSGAPGFGLLAAAAIAAAARVARRWTVGVAGAAILLLLATAPWTGTLATSVISSRISTALSGVHAAQRIEIWTIFQDRVQDRPILGHGFDTSFKVYQASPPGYRPPGLDMAVIENIHPHDVFLQFWVELGVIGAALAAGVFAFVFWGLSRGPAASLPFRLGLLATVVCVGLVGLSAWHPWWLASIVASLLWFAGLDRAGRPT